MVSDGGRLLEYFIIDLADSMDISFPRRDCLPLIHIGARKEIPSIGGLAIRALGIW